MLTYSYIPGKYTNAEVDVMVETVTWDKVITGVETVFVVDFPETPIEL